ncbi:MAG: multidrug ABC transporter ATP-binding protein [Ignavibacteria bacterium RIFOXYB2_FULL_35_12]|nr:MAG: multidrug ABC transporter ATP-binding protein [Ignavibacteria bacterium GWA2_36_19]OGU62174.1 MAG: multidrug ABC transporter ATP-binding protein [Ignavibacteria bacterium GWF2_35_20]OGU82211.1 MAG: multidrug ABC transporter ATP-binding protein [Ignavibacteria bacterium RIFOXYA2_FULL_35_9]OGU84580.1 MAG: multidrug ABC transporter ATP-binding protein [Ignavibacteria bacterium RIFOXYA12_FULL_35_25]OGU96850.1 MAG: multidrug ABC transporter ATP-binding protein [Ignavibacteria bacterium RIFOX
MNDAIKIENLKRSYNEIIAVKGVSYSVAKGEMFGLVGPDGAGKTTTIRMLTGLLRPDSGNAEVLSYDLLKQQNLIKNEIGYLSQKFSLYGDLTIDENIEFFADIHGVKNFKDRRNELLEFTRLTPFRDRLADKLSGGMKQKLALACTLIHKPKIIFLDEPTTGVDPVSRRDFWKILSDLQKDGITIFMTTPYLDEAERCNRIALMNNGEIISWDTPKNVKASLKAQIVEIVCSPIREAYNIIKAKTGFEVQMYDDRLNVALQNFNNDYTGLENLLVENKIQIVDKRIITPSLENVFIHLISKAS